MTDQGAETRGYAEESNPPVETIDIHAWKAEEANRAEEKNIIKELLTNSVIKNEGNHGMVNRALRIENSNKKPLKCHAAYVWYNLGQRVARKDETPYEDESGWSDRAINLRPVHLAAINEVGEVGKNFMRRKFHTERHEGEDYLKPEGAIVDICVTDAKPFTTSLKDKDKGKKIKRPEIGLTKIRIGWCKMQSRNATEYNDHARDFHGIILDCQEDQEASMSDQDDSIQDQQVEEGATKALEVMVPALRRIGANKGKYVPLNGMKMKPSKKEVEEGIEELKNVIAADGSWARATDAKTTPLDAYGHIVTRIRELIHEDDWPKMERKYCQLSGKKWGRNQVMKISHIETAIREVICQNSGENAIIAFSKFRLSETESLSKQMLELGEMVNEFFPEESKIIAYKKDINGEMVPEGPMYTRQVKDIFCVYKILENVPKSELTGYSGKIRQLLRPILEDITKFNMEEFIKEIKKFETDWFMFEKKPKPATPAEEATVGMAEGAAAEAATQQARRPFRKLKSRARMGKFTKASYKVHKEKVDSLATKLGTKQRCYWCVTSNCLAVRQLKKPDIKATNAESRQRLDNATREMCEKAEEISKRSEPGAVVFTTSAAIKATVFRASIREAKKEQIEIVAKTTLEKDTTEAEDTESDETTEAEAEDTESDETTEAEEILEIGLPKTKNTIKIKTTRRGFLSSTLETKEVQKNVTSDMIEVENVELDELTGTEDIPAIRLPEANSFKKNETIGKEQEMVTSARDNKTENQNKGSRGWKNTLRITLLGLMILWVTLCPLEVSPEILSYMMIGIQMTMGNTTQGKEPVTEKKVRKN